LLFNQQSQTLIRISFTIILLGYFLVWLPQPVAGLSFIGLELGEWVKFLPQARQGEILPSRNFFYLPPVTLGAMMALWTVRWSNRRWRTWVIRGTALLISLLALPAIESFLYEPVSQWILRLLFIGVVPIAILLATTYASKESVPDTIPWVYFVGLGLIGALFPLWIYLAIRPVVGEIIGSKVGFGVGILLNILGHGLLGALGMIYLSRSKSVSSTKFFK
jgi:hypothetical protein